MADLLILAIETATGCGSVALTRGSSLGGKVLAEYTLQPELTHSRRLLGSVAAMMAAAGVTWAEVDEVAVSQGPGSFTGLRIGMAAAKGIAMAANSPLLGVPTLDALASQLTPTALPVCCLLDARKQQVYAGWYRFADEGCQRSGECMVLSVEQLLATVQEPTLLVGPGAAAWSTALTAHPLVRLHTNAVLHPRAAAVGFCAADRLAGGEMVENNLVPLYVRASEAELNVRPMENNG